MIGMHKDHVLIIGDTHLPFVHKHYLDFCKEIQARVKCGTVVHIGDLVDNHAISYHEHHPSGRSPADEMAEADKLLKGYWFKAFPKLKLCRGNHDRLVDRKAKTAGLPERAFKPFRQIWDLPAGWEDSTCFIIDDVEYTHGTLTGPNAHIGHATHNRQSTVIGHTHSTGAINYLVSNKDRIFGMNVGCGIDRNTYAFEYGRDFCKKPVLGCGVVTDQGKFCQFFPMDL